MITAGKDAVRPRVPRGHKRGRPAPSPPRGWRESGLPGESASIVKTSDEILILQPGIGELEDLAPRFRQRFVIGGV